MSIRMTGIDHNLAGIDVRTVFSLYKKEKKGGGTGVSEDSAWN